MPGNPGVRCTCMYLANEGQTHGDSGSEEEEEVEEEEEEEEEEEASSVTSA